MVSVSGGIFTVRLDFGAAAFSTTGARFLEIQVGSTVLSPRQEITSTPFAQRSLTAANAESLGGVDAGQSNTTGANNTVIGKGANVASGALTFATALGSGAVVSTSNSVVLGRAADTVNIPGSLNVSGNVSSGCRDGFTAVANGRLCISATQPANTFYNAAQTCTNMGARLGNSADVALSFTLSGFNYFAGSPGGEPVPKGWLADIINDGVRATWNTNSPMADFDGTPLNVNNGGVNGTAPQLLYRCVY